MAPSSPPAIQSERAVQAALVGIPLLPPSSPLTPAYLSSLEIALKSDGCTLVSEVFHSACVVHDLGYKWGIDPWGKELSRREIDRNFRKQIQSMSKLGVFSPVSWVRWAGVRVFGGLFRREAA